MLTGNHNQIHQRMQQAQQMQQNPQQQPGVLTGARTNPMQQQQQYQQGGMQQQGFPQQGMQQQNPLGQLMYHAQRFGGGMNGGQNGMNSLYNFSTSQNPMAAMMGMDEVQAEAQMKAQAIMQGSQMGSILMNICFKRQQQNQMFRAMRGAMEFFKVPRKNMPQEQILSEFINEVDQNQTLYGWIVSNISIMFSSEMSYRIAQGDSTVTQNRELWDDATFRSTVDVLNLQFMDYLSRHPEGPSILYRASPVLKEALSMRENASYQVAIERFTWLEQQCPWKNGKITEIQSRGQFENPLTQFQSFSEIADYGLGGGYTNPNQNMMTASEQHEMRLTQEYISRAAAAHDAGRVNHNGNGQQNPSEGNGSWIQAVSYSNFDKPVQDIHNLTVNNRHEYCLADWAKQIPGTDYWVMDSETSNAIRLIMLDKDGLRISKRDIESYGVVPVFKIDWQNCIMDYRLVPHKFEDADFMSRIISDPSILLPLMYEQDGIQKTTYDPKVLETKDLIKNSKVLPVEEVKELGREVDIILSSKVIATEQANDVINNKVETYVETYDPKGKTDAFIIPMNALRQWHVESHVNMDEVYSSFGMMVKDPARNKGVTDTARVLRSISAAANNHPAEEFVGFVEPYLTALVNRYLVEVRGYAETPEEAKAEKIRGVKIDSVFTDLGDLLEWLRDNDIATLNAFLDYNTNDFMRDGIEILAPRDEAMARAKIEADKEEDEVIAAAIMAEREQSLLMKRETLFININNEAGPQTTHSVVVKESANPRIFAIIRKAVNSTSKHFNDTPQVLLKFGNDKNKNIWVATPSGQDSEHVIVLRTVSMGQAYAHVEMVHS